MEKLQKNNSERKTPSLELFRAISEIGTIESCVTIVSATFKTINEPICHHKQVNMSLNTELIFKKRPNLSVEPKV